MTTFEQGQDTRGRILDAARQLFAERGYAATSLADIASAVGLTKTAVAYHFHPKDRLAAELIAPAREDVVALLDHLGIERADVFGHSMGAAVALELAVAHPSRTGDVVAACASVRPHGMHEDLTDPAKQATSTRMPSAQDFADMRDAYLRLSPHPDQFEAFLGRLSASNADLKGWSDEQLAGISAPTLLVMGDHDFVTIEHGALMKRLIPGSHLAVLPNTNHMNVTLRSELLLPMLAEFLD